MPHGSHSATITYVDDTEHFSGACHDTVFAVVSYQTASGTINRKTVQYENTTHRIAHFKLITRDGNATIYDPATLGWDFFNNDEQVQELLVGIKFHDGCCRAFGCKSPTSWAIEVKVELPAMINDDLDKTQFLWQGHEI